MSFSPGNIDALRLPLQQTLEIQRSMQAYISHGLAMRNGHQPTQRVVPGLLSLPNELLATIWSYVPRLDIENMSLVNRRIHLLGEEFITRHRSLKNRYRRGKKPQCINASISDPARHAPIKDVYSRKDDY